MIRMRMRIYEREENAGAKVNISERRLSMLDDTSENENMREDDLIAEVLEVEILYK